LVQEARVLAEHHAEIVLTGVHIGTYGQDREAGNGKRETSSLGELLEALITAVPAVRFRLSSIEATEVDDTIARFLIEAPRNLAARVGQTADGVVSGHGAGKVEVLTQDYVSLYLPTQEWNGSARFEVTVR